MNGFCDICGDAHNDTSFALKCGHFFHYDCLCMSVSISKCRQCPYCRKPFTLSVSRMKEIYKKKNRPRCCAILKSGVRKGEVCNALSKKIVTHDDGRVEYYCGRHYSVVNKSITST